VIVNEKNEQQPCQAIGASISREGDSPERRRPLIA
jgi:hypothetical protein